MMWKFKRFFRDLSHKFWLWLGDEIEKHKVLEELDKRFTRVKAEEVDRILNSNVLRGRANEFVLDGLAFLYNEEDLIVKGYEKSE